MGPAVETPNRTHSSSDKPDLAYGSLLRQFCQAGSEELLYRASLLSQEFIAAGIPPDEIVALHAEAVQTVGTPFDPRNLVSSQQFLLEVMIAYGVRYSEYADVRLAEANKALELEHVRAETATRAETDRREMLAVISHELATPLTVAKGNVTAIRRFLGADSAQPHEMLPRALDAELAIERMLVLREELVAASRNELRSLELAPLKVENPVLRAVRWAEPGAKEKGVSISCDFSATSSHVVADPDALQSIFGNVLSNAVRYTPAGGSITVRTRNLDGDVLVEIQDTGIGLSEEAQARLFERFYRAPEAKRMASWGLGLGLTIANELAQALGATLAATSQPGVGSTFTVRFPPAADFEEE